VIINTEVKFSKHNKTKGSNLLLADPKTKGSNLLLADP